MQKQKDDKTFPSFVQLLIILLSLSWSSVFIKDSVINPMLHIQ
jgi:hypothetical protein